jgi:hypothetical protein
MSNDDSRHPSSSGDLLERFREFATPERRVKAAAWLLLACVIGWPMTSLTLFRAASIEAQGILALSWVAIILACLQLIVSTDIRREQEDEEN